MSGTARDVMSSDCQCMGESESVLDAAKIVSQADLARHADQNHVGQMVGSISV